MRTLLVSLFAALVCVSASVAAGAAVAKGAHGYGGLGATVKAFYANNPHGSRFPPLGVAYYKVEGTKHGRVTAYQVTINSKPKTSARGRLFLLDGVDLPSDAHLTKLNSTYCAVWRSKRLGMLIGMQYAAATTTRHESTTAVMRAERKPHC